MRYSHAIYSIGQLKIESKRSVRVCCTYTCKFQFMSLFVSNRFGLGKCNIECNNLCAECLRHSINKLLLLFGIALSSNHIPFLKLIWLPASSDSEFSNVTNGNGRNSIYSQHFYLVFKVNSYQILAYKKHANSVSYSQFSIFCSATQFSCRFSKKQKQTNLTNMKV